MKQPTVFKQFAHYVTLNVLGMLGLSCYILADTYFVAKGLGANGLTALNLAIPVYSFIHGCGLMLGMGGATRFSIAHSQDNTAAANQAFSVTALCALCFAAAFFVLGLFFSEGLTRLLGADALVFSMCQTYLQVILLFAPMFILNNLLLCFVRNAGAPQLSMMAMLGGSLSNILLDYLFIFPCQMGIFGAVLATGLAPIVSLLILLPFFVKRRNPFHFVTPRPTRRLVQSILSGGLPSLINEISSGIVMIAFNRIILHLCGNIGVAAYGVVANLSLVILAMYTGIAQGIQPLISRNYGRGNAAFVQTLFRYALVTTLTLSGLLYATLFLGAHQITALFNSEANPALHALAVPGMRIYFIACPFAGCNILLAAYFAATNSPRPAGLISVFRGFLFILPMAFLLSACLGMVGVWSAFPAAEGFTCLIAFALYLRSRVASTPSAARSK